MKKFVCPMHSDIVSDKPGSCPKCGMELVEVNSSRDKELGSQHNEHENHHAHMAEDFRTRFFAVLPLTILVLFLSPNIEHWLNLSVDLPYQNILLFVLGTFVVLYGGQPFYREAVRELKTRNYGMMTLVSLAVLSGYFFSILATFLFKGESLWWEISTLVLAFLFGHWLEMRAVLGTGNALGELSKLIPLSAHLIQLVHNVQNVHDVPTESLQIGDNVLVKPGEKIPIDGEVIEGDSSVNESMITGESRPVGKNKGDVVIGGSINGDGSLTIRVTKIGRETAIAQISELIERAQETKPSVQKLADKAANFLTIIAIVVGVGTFVYWFFVNPQGAIFASTLAISVIVITCPHALGLAIPTVTTITSALAAKAGILIRDMRGLEVAKNIDYVVFDKTGTLTEGNFVVTGGHPVRGMDENELFKLAAAVEMHSQHPIAKAIVAEAVRRKVKIPDVKNFKSHPGHGVEGYIGKSKIEISGPGVIVVKDGKTVGEIKVEDKIRDESKEAVARMHKLGIKTAMLTGDKKEIGEEVGKEIGIDTIFSEVLPGDKVQKVRELQEKGYKVAMVGDGVNDAPSLKQAHVGIAIGAGTDVAIESAEIVLVKSNPLDVVKIINLSRKVDVKMKQNLAWATGYNVLAIPAAAGVFIPWGIMLRPEWGAILMSASSLIVVANALLLKNARL